MKRTIITLFVLLVSTPITALGQENENGVTSFTFDDELIDGDLFNPNGEVLTVPPKPTHRSLIRAREHFFPEMFKSIEDL
ncbi:MAG: hypothetical protein JXA30_20555 [Deltaproteobacteria bacterium]|nr:hypothetical protein [Deltaproteobacteria bacterium]